MSRLAVEPNFRPPSCSYSYHWPSASHSPHIFGHFLSGYSRRNQDISNALAATDRGVAVVTDIKSFYPTVNQQYVLSEFRQMLDDSSFSKPESASAIILCEELFSATIDQGKGLPIGPALSHLLGHIALRVVDRELSSEFPGRYFRYVDDIVIVTPSENVAFVESRLQEVLGRQDLTLNNDKWDEVDRDTWMGGVPTIGRGRSDGVAMLLKRLRFYLCLNPKNYENVRTLFIANGFYFPFTNLRSINDKRNVRFLVNSVWPNLSWDSLTQFVFNSPERMLRDGMFLREYFTKQAERLANASQPPHGMLRRWHVQNCRYVFNRLLYLTPPTEYSKVLTQVPEMAELFQLRLVLRSFIDADVTRLLDCPGPPILAFSQIWRESKPEQTRITWPQHLSDHQVDGCALLALNGVSLPPDHLVHGIVDTERQAFVKFCMGDAAVRREFSDFTYIDEMRCLQLGSTVEEKDRLLHSRFDIYEDIRLQGLDLDGGDSMS